VFREAGKIAAVIHFAGYKVSGGGRGVRVLGPRREVRLGCLSVQAVGESRMKPLTYFDNNLVSTIVLLECMAAAGVKTLLFSSSCTVYGESAPPLTEEASTGVVRGLLHGMGWFLWRGQGVVEDSSSCAGCYECVRTDQVHH
jgi:hypothetical protein